MFSQGKWQPKGDRGLAGLRPIHEPRLGRLRRGGVGQGTQQLGHGGTFRMTCACVFASAIIIRSPLHKILRVFCAPCEVDVTYLCFVSPCAVICTPIDLTVNRSFVAIL